MSDALLRTDQVAARLNVKESTLRQWRVKGTGPEFVKITQGTIRYPADRFEDWLRSRMAAAE